MKNKINYIYENILNLLAILSLVAIVFLAILIEDRYSVLTLTYNNILKIKEYAECYVSLIKLDTCLLTLDVWNILLNGLINNNIKNTIIKDNTWGNEIEMKNEASLLLKEINKNA